MKYSNYKSSPKATLIWIVSICLLVAIAAAGALYAFGFGPFSNNTTSDNPEPTAAELEKQQKTSNDNKKEFAESTKDIELPGVDPETPSSPDTITITPSKDAGIVTLKTQLQGYASGECSLTATNGGKTMSETAPILYQPEFSTCAGFSIVIDNLGTGTWTISLDVTPSGGQMINKIIKYRV